MTSISGYKQLEEKSSTKNGIGNSIMENGGEISIKFDYRSYTRKSLRVKKRRKSFQIFRNFFGKKKSSTKQPLDGKFVLRRRSSVKSIEFWEV